MNGRNSVSVSIAAPVRSIASIAGKALTTIILAVALLHGGLAAANAPGITIAVSPNPGVFPDTRVFFSSFGDFTVTNNSASTLTITGLDTGGSTVFVIDSISSVVSVCGVGTALLPGDACTLNIQFTPTTIGTSSAVLTIGTDTPDTTTVGLSGIGGTMLGTITPAAGAAFPATAVGVSATPIDLTMTNVGTFPIVFQPDIFHLDLSIPADFGFTGNCFGATVNPGNACTFTVTFTPTTTGPLSYDAASLLNQVTNGSFFTNSMVDITGTGVTPAPALSASPPTGLAFGAQPIGTFSAAQQIDVTNTGNTPITIGSVAMTAGAADYLVTNNCPVSPSTLAMGITCSVLVNLHPSAIGARPGTLQIVSDAPSSPDNFSLTGTGLAAMTPAFSPSATSFVFAARQVGTSSAAQMLTITNTGSTSMLILSISSTTPDYAVTHNCPMPAATLGIGLSCAVNITFTPTATGSRPGAVTITTNAAGSPHAITLSGSGLSAPAPGVSFNPPTLSFGSQGIGTTSAAKRSVLSNNGSVALTVQSISSLGDFGFVSDCPLAPATIGPSGTCNIDVTFSPLSGGSQTASVSINDNAPGSPHGIGLSGQGVPVLLPAIAVTGGPLAFGDRVLGSTSPAQTLTVSNTGQANLSLSNIAVNGAGFLRVAATPASADCGAVVAPSASCQIALVFAPSAVGAVAGSVVIQHNAASPTVTVSLSGNGTPVPQPLIRLSGALAFGDQIVATASAAKGATITNGGTAALVISGLTVTGANAGDFAITGNCVTTLAPNATCAFNITFTPTALGARAAGVTVASNAQNATGNSTLALSGNGVPVPVPVVRLSATTLGFGNVIYGGTPAGQGVTLGNIGTAPLLIQGVSTSGNSDFTQTNNCGSSLAAQAQCTISIRFAPHALGARSGTVTIRSNAAGSPHTVQMGGTGCRYFSPAAARFFLTSC